MCNALDVVVTASHFFCNRNILAKILYFRNVTSVGLQAVGLTSRKACGMLDFDDVEEKEINV
jgi:hypothetical protein